MHESYLSDLSDSQIAFSATFLEDVFLHRKTNLSNFRPDDLNAICALIKSVNSKQMKHALLIALDSPLQVQIAQKMDDSELHLLFSYHTDLPLLKLIFQSLPEHRKETVIQPLFHEDKLKFNELKPLLETVSAATAHTASLTAHDLQQLVLNEIKQIIQFILDPHYSVEALKEYGLDLEQRLPIEHFEPLSRRLISEFSHLNIPLSNKENFASHIKFYNFLVPYLLMFPKLNIVILHPIDSFLSALNKLPNGVWVIKVLSQLPKSIIELCIDRLKSYPRIGELQKRAVYSKLLTVIYENAHIPEGSQIRMMLEG